MSDQYNKLKKVHEQEQDYQIPVKVDFYFEDESLNADSVKVPVKFDIDLEFRTWGLRGIYLNFYDVIEVEFTEINSAGEETPRNVKVDLSELKQEWYEGSAYTATGIDLYFDKTGKIDYKKSVIRLAYLTKD